MTALKCRRARRLVDRRAAGLTEAERADLQQHLAACAACAWHARALDQVTAVVRARAEERLSDEERERVIARALDAAPAAAPRAVWSASRFALVGVAVAAMVVVALRLRKPDVVATGGADRESVVERQRPGLVSGDLEVG